MRWFKTVILAIRLVKSNPVYLLIQPGVQHLPFIALRFLGQTWISTGVFFFLLWTVAMMIMLCLQHWRQQSYRRETLGWRNGGVAIEKLSISALRLNWAVTEWECGCDKSERLPLRNKQASSPAVWNHRRPKVCMKDFQSWSRALFDGLLADTNSFICGWRFRKIQSDYSSFRSSKITNSKVWLRHTLGKVELSPLS